MSSMQFLQWLQESPLARSVSESSFLVGAGLQIVHIFGLFLLFAAVGLISRRLLGLLLREHPVTLLSRAVTRFIWIGLARATVFASLSVWLVVAWAGRFIGFV
jgi:hypothetical protein